MGRGWHIVGGSCGIFAGDRGRELTVPAVCMSVWNNRSSRVQGNVHVDDVHHACCCTWLATRERYPRYQLDDWRRRTSTYVSLSPNSRGDRRCTAVCTDCRREPDYLHGTRHAYPGQRGLHVRRGGERGACSICDRRAMYCPCA